MSDESTPPTPHDTDPVEASTRDGAAEPTAGFSSTEKAVGAYAAYRSPLLTGLAAGALLRDETDPVRRRQLGGLRTVAFAWWAASALVALVILAVVLVSMHSMGAGMGGGGACRGEPDEYAVEDITYQGDDAGHWTATYPCTDGGMTTVPVPRNKVPGEGFEPTVGP